MDILQKEAIIAAFEREKINVEITENKKGQIVVSRMCELRKEQVFADEIPWDDAVEQALKEKVSLTVKPDLRKMIIQDQEFDKSIKELEGSLDDNGRLLEDTRAALEQSDQQVLEDTLQLLDKIEDYLEAIRPA